MEVKIWGEGGISRKSRLTLYRVSYCTILAVKRRSKDIINKYYTEFIKNLLIVILIGIIGKRNIVRSKKFKNNNLMTYLSY